MNPLTIIALSFAAVYLLALVYGYVRTWLQMRDLAKRIEQAGPMSDEEWEAEWRSEDGLYE